MEPEHAARLGVIVEFGSGDRIRVDQAVEQLRLLGIRHVRIRVFADSVGDDWYRWMFERLGEFCEVLAHVQIGDSAAVERLLRVAGDRLSAVEVGAAGDLLDADAIVAAGRVIREAGRIAVVSVAGDVDFACLHRMGEAGVLQAFDVVGLRAETGSAETARGLAALRKIAGCYVPGLEFWITDIGCAGVGYSEVLQARGFLDALNLPAERVYWNGLQDIDEDALTGLQDCEGQPRLLGRLLGHGVGHVAACLHNPAPAILSARPIMVTGGAGFIGANLADRIASEGHDVLIYDALARPGVERNLSWLKQRHPRRIAVTIADLRDEPALTEAARGASAVFHLAAQVAVTTSLVRPVQDFDINVRGTLTLLEALRRFNPEAPLLFASTNKVYGDLGDITLERRGDQYLPDDPGLRARGIDETRPLCFHTPYGCSKGAADQYVLDYAHSFGLRTAVLRMSCIYGERQWGTEDQGWLAHFLLRAIAGESLTIYGDGRQVRDVLHIDDAVDTYMAAWQDIDRIAGRAFNLGGGPANAISLLELIDHIERIMGRRIALNFEDWRAGDQRYFVADASAVRETLGLDKPLGWREGVARLADHFGARPEPVHVPERAL